MYALLAPIHDFNSPNQLRVTNASEGKVDFELDITKDHTVRLHLCPFPSLQHNSTNNVKRTVSKSSMAGQ